MQGQVQNVERVGQAAVAANGENGNGDGAASTPAAKPDGAAVEGGGSNADGAATTPASNPSSPAASSEGEVASAEVAASGNGGKVLRDHVLSLPPVERPVTSVLSFYTYHELEHTSTRPSPSRMLLRLSG